jgi:hypothetical protein
MTTGRLGGRFAGAAGQVAINPAGRGQFGCVRSFCLAEEELMRSGGCSFPVRFISHLCVVDYSSLNNTNEY